MVNILVSQQLITAAKITTTKNNNRKTHHQQQIMKMTNKNKNNKTTATLTKMVTMNTHHSHISDPRQYNILKEAYFRCKPLQASNNEASKYLQNKIKKIVCRELKCKLVQSALDPPLKIPCIYNIFFYMNTKNPR